MLPFPNTTRRSFASNPVAPAVCVKKKKKKKRTKKKYPCPGIFFLFRKEKEKPSNRGRAWWYQRLSVGIKTKPAHVKPQLL